MPLPSGTWKANVNGTECDLVIDAPDQQGGFRGQFAGVDVQGFWDEVSQTITFSVIIPGSGTPTPPIALFRGCLFRFPANPPPGRDVVAILTGFVQMTIGGVPDWPFPEVGSSQRNIFGWMAQIPEIR